MRVAKRLLRRIRDFADIAREEVIGLERARSALDELEIDAIGLDARDRAILSEKFAGEPVGLGHPRHLRG